MVYILEVSLMFCLSQCSIGDHTELAEVSCLWLTVSSLVEVLTLESEVRSQRFVPNGLNCDEN